MSSKLSLFDALIENVTSTAPVLETAGGECWAMAEAEEGMGLGMMTPCDSIPALYARSADGLVLRYSTAAFTGDGEAWDGTLTETEDCGRTEIRWA